VTAPGRAAGRCPCALVLVLVAAALPSAAGAAAFNVNDTADAVDASPGDGVCASAGGTCTLRAAIQEANAGPGADTVSVPAGTYVLSIAGSDDSAAAGDLDVTDPLTIVGAGARTTIIDANGIDRAVHAIASNGLTISGVTLRNGLAASNTDGGGIESGTGALRLTDVAVVNNAATRDGGGLNKSLGTLVMTDVTLSGNSAVNGGAVAHQAGNLDMTNVTVSGNFASGNGGGLYVPAGVLNLLNVTITGNSAAIGGGIYGGGGGTDVITNAIFANSGSGGNCSTPQTSAGNNLDSGDTCGLAGPGDLINTNPVLGALQNNGGSTDTHVLLAASPAIDAGTNSGCPATDQRGAARPQDGDVNGVFTCDIGAYELTGGAPPPAGPITLGKEAEERDFVVGEVVPFTVTARNAGTSAAAGLTIQDMAPPGFQLVTGSASLSRAGLDGLLGTGDDVTGSLAASGSRPVVFGPLDLASGESVRLRYLMRLGSGVEPGEHRNRATPFQGASAVGNTATARIVVTLDPMLDLSTIIGKVFEDRNGNGWQDPEEPGIAKAMVALDDGTYALTDEHGRYHFPAVKPGHRMVKLNLHSLPRGATAASEESRVLWITPGLTAKASFGVLLSHSTETIGGPPETGLEVTAQAQTKPTEFMGSASTLTALADGQLLPLPSAEAILSSGAAEGTVQITEDRVARPARFELRVAPPDRVRSWTLTIAEASGQVVRAIEGEGEPPESLPWDGLTNDGQLVRPGEIYEYQMEARFDDGSGATSTRRRLAVNRSTVFSLRLTGEAFASGKAELNHAAKKVLEQAAEGIRVASGGRIVIEGHTDRLGSSQFNMDLSRRRAEAARGYLVQSLRFPAERIVVRWYGEERPVASNDTAEGRALNRRVDIRAEAQKVESTEVLDQHRSPASVRVNGAEVSVAENNRFAVRIDTRGSKELEIEMSDPFGRSARATVPLPDLEVTNPLGRYLLPHGGSDRGCSAAAAQTESAPGQPAAPGALQPASVVACRLEGRTSRGNSVELNGEPLEVSAAGEFVREILVRPGTQSYAVLTRNGAGLTRFVNLLVRLSDRDAEGNRVVVAEAVPNLTVQLPPEGARLTSAHLPLTGSTDPGNSVSVNGEPLEVRSDGSFSGAVDLPTGKSVLTIEVKDPLGWSGRIERGLEVAGNQLFLMAFADGRVGKFTGDGAIDSAGLGEESALYTEGRVAFYLKGRIAGKYLITSAFDSDKNQVESVFSDLKLEETRRLLTNLDPDKLYPVYGDAGTVGYDVESREKLYLALDGDEIHFLIGNYPLALSGTELAAYRRTLYGGRFAFQSASRTRYGEPHSEIVVFAADVGQAHVHDEVRATGGSLYYLSHRDLIQGSEEVTLVVRDQNTGLALSRERQRQNLDYTIKYDEGRIMFRRPVASVVQSGSLVDQAILSGHRVFIQVDYETRVQRFEKSATGVRARQQVGDHFAIGGTYVKDELEAGSYELAAVDGEVRLGSNSRLVAEYAASAGADSIAFVSEDGGVNYTEVPTTGGEEGAGWRAAADLDLGEWFERPDRYRLRLYVKELDSGFSSSGNLLEQGSRKAGLSSSLKLTEKNTLDVRLDREDRLGSAAPGTAEVTTIGSLQWNHTRKRWGGQAELLENRAEDAAGQELALSRLGAARVWTHLTDRLTGRLEHQQTLSGADNDRSTLDLEYRVLPALTLGARGTHGTQGDSLQGGAVLALGGAEVYLTERLADDLAGSRTATVLGARSPLGPSSRVYTEYQWEGAESGDRTVSLLGVQRQWDLGPGFKFVLSGERANVGAEAQDLTRSSTTASLSYSNKGGLTALTRNQVRLESGAERRRQLLTSNRIQWSFSPDFSLFAKYGYSGTADRDTDQVEARLEERTLGVAYRPVKHDRFNALGRYTRLLDLNPLRPGESAATGRTLDVVSLELVTDFRPGLQWVVKGAVNWQERLVPGFPTVETTTYLSIQRLNLSVWRKLEVGAEYRVRWQDESEDRSQGWLTETMWKLHKYFRVGGGYNFTDFSDNLFAQNDYSARGWFVRVQGKY